ncbi:DUF2608 domain-containing protein [Candidatus Babeliales bacterium]|nr:DUF2608 domain-containing protein [Candidatus Babeliales bacterium]
MKLKVRSFLFCLFLVVIFRAFSCYGGIPKVSSYEKTSYDEALRMNCIRNIVNEAFAKGLEGKDILLIFDIDGTIFDLFDKNNSRISSGKLWNYIVRSVKWKNLGRLRKIGNLPMKEDLLEKALEDLGRDKAHYFISELQRRGVLTPFLTERRLPKLIDELYKLGISMIAITAREWDMKKCTDQQLKKIGIDLEKTSFYKETCTFENDVHGFYKGTLYLTPRKTCNMNKGKLLNDFLEKAESSNYSTNFKLVIYIDDVAKYLYDIKKSVKEKEGKIDCKCLLYGRDDDCNFDEDEIKKVLDENFGKCWWKINTYSSVYNLGNFLKGVLIDLCAGNESCKTP